MVRFLLINTQTLVLGETPRIGPFVHGSGRFAPAMAKSAQYARHFTLPFCVSLQASHTVLMHYSKLANLVKSMTETSFFLQMLKTDMWCPES